MARVSIDVFSGIQPRLDPTSLGDNQATIAMNCRLHTTKLNPINQPKSVTDMKIRLEGGLTNIKNAKTIAIWQRGYDKRDIIAWPGIVHIAPSNINADDRWRLFVSGDTGVNDENGDNQPCVFVTAKGIDSYDRHRIFMSTPPSAIIENQVLRLKDPNMRYAYFFQTWVDEYGYESGMSPVLVNGDTDEKIEVKYVDGDKINWKQILANEIPEQVVARRLYKTIAGNEVDTVRFVVEEKISNDGIFTELTDIIIKDEDVGEEFPNLTAIPTDLTCIQAMPGNFYVGFKRSNPRHICFSDINIPTSYPDEYQYSIRDIAIGIAVAGNTAFILTNGYPWAISGTDPNGMTAAQIVSEQACISPRSICTMEGRVFYASQDGICSLAENSLNASVITRAYWDKVAWSKLNPKSCIMQSYDNALFCWFTLFDGSHDAYIIDFDVGGNPIITQHNDYASCAFVDVQNDALYFVRA